MAKRYVDGIYFNPPGDEDPDFVISSVKIDLKQFSDFVQDCEENGWTKKDKKGDRCIFFNISQRRSGDGFAASMFKKDKKDEEF